MPLVPTANWVSHLEYEWQNEVRRPPLEALTRHFTLLRYDQRGCGLSDWTAKNISFEVWLTISTLSSTLRDFAVSHS